MDTTNWNMLYMASTTKHPKFDIGDRVVLPDGRTFHYGLAGAGAAGTALEASLTTEFAVCCPDASITNAVAPAQTPLVGLPLGVNLSVGKAGDTAMCITVAATDGRSTTTPGTGTGLIAADELRGGFVVIGNGTNQVPMCRGIIGNTAVATGGGICTLFLDAVLYRDIVVGTDNCEAYLNVFGNVRNMNIVNSNYVTCIGAATVPATYGQYVWIQTYGNVWLTSDSVTGEAAHGRDLYVNSNGALRGQTTTTYAGYQRIGVGLDQSASNRSNGPNCFLQLFA
jgi:hypothetical protein